MIRLEAVAWSEHLTALGACFSRLARSVIDRSFRAGYRGEVKLEPASADSWIGLAAVKPSVQAMNSEGGKSFLLEWGRGFLGVGLR